MNGLDLLQDYDACTQGAQLIIIDNGSDEPTAEALRTLPKERGIVIRNETNVGFAAANNQGYARAEGDIIVFLNSDVAGDSVWLKFVADDVKDGYLYGPSVTQQLVYGMWLPYVEGWCIAATRKTWDSLSHSSVDTLDPEKKHARSYGWGPWDEDSYHAPYWEDNDLCYRALQAGIGLVAVQWPIQHKGGRTAGPIAKHGASFERNRATFAKRVAPVWEDAQR